MSVKSSQPWLKITFLSTLLTCLCSYWLIAHTWSYYSEWGSFQEHEPHIWSSTYDLATGYKLEQTYYANYLSDNGLWPDFILHLAIPFLGSAILITALVFKLFYVPGGVSEKIHLKGNKVYEGRDAVALINKQMRPEISNKEVTGGKGIYIHPQIPISKKRELENILIFGQQGAGKSVINKGIVHQIIERGDKVVIYDNKREYTSSFFSRESSILLAPTDARSTVWKPCIDICDASTAKLFAECLIPCGSGDEAIWTTGSQLILTGWLVYLSESKPTNGWGWEDVSELLKVSDKRLDTVLQTYFPAATSFIEENSKTTQSFRSTIASYIGWLVELAELWPNSSSSNFSIKSWCQRAQAKPTLIVPHDPEKESMSESLCKAIFAILTRALLSLEDSSTRRLWLSLDELGNMPATPGLEKQLSLGRSKGLRTVIGVQSLSQLRTLYGADRTETILSLFGSIICLRVGAAGDSIKRASESFGKRCIRVPSETVKDDGSKSTSFNELEEAALKESDITALPQASSKGVTGFISLLGCEAIGRLEWPISRNYESDICPFVRKKITSNSSSRQNRLKRRC